MTRTHRTDVPARRAGLSAAILAGLCLAVLAACSDEGDKAAPAGLVQPAAAQDGAPATVPAPAKAAEVPPADGTVDVAELMAEGPLPDIVMGNADAPVTIVEYASMTCPHCADFAANTLPAIKKAYIDTGKAKLILREFPFDPQAVRRLHAGAPARRAGGGTRWSTCSSSSRRPWARSQKASAALLAIAKLAGFTQESFTACLSDKDLQARSSPRSSAARPSSASRRPRPSSSTATATPAR